MPCQVHCKLGKTWSPLLVFGSTRKKALSPFQIYHIVLHLCYSIISKVLATCPPAVHLNFDGLNQSQWKNMVKDESGNNNFATMKNDAQVISSGGKCDDAASLNGMGFKCYVKYMKRLKILKQLKIPFLCVNLSLLI